MNQIITCGTTVFAPLPTGKFNIIYIDPPWDYYKGGNRNARRHYSVVPIEALQRLPIIDIAADSCVLLMWCISPILPVCLDLPTHWGFRYATKFSAWAKTTKDGRPMFGCGGWTRAGSEDLFMFRRGKIPRSKLPGARSVRQLFMEPPRAHSQKPDRVRDDIITVFGDLPRIELFARQATPGWAVWGNEVD